MKDSSFSVSLVLAASNLQNDLKHSSSLALIEAPFNTFANRADPDQAALVKSCLIRVYSVCLWKYMIRYRPTQEDMTSNFFVLCTNVKVYLYNYS